MRSIRCALPTGRCGTRPSRARGGKEAVDTERGFWVVFAEILATHPNLTKRVRAVLTVEHAAVPRPSQLRTLATDSINPA